MGQRDEPPGKAGLANLTTGLMAEATLQRSSAEFSEALERIGASVSSASGQYETTVTLNVLSKHLDAGMALMMERILEPAFTEEDFTRVKTQLDGIPDAGQEIRSVAGRARHGRGSCRTRASAFLPRQWSAINRERHHA